MFTERPKSPRYPIIDWRDIQSASWIERVEELPQAYLKELYNMYKHICEVNSFIALAGTQVPDQEHTNIVYLKGDERFSCENLLLINPTVIACSGRGINIEGCGSIGEGRVSFLAVRPKKTKIAAYGYRPSCGLFKIYNEELYDLESFVFTHEMEHIAGGSIYTHPERLLSLTDTASWGRYTNIYTTGMVEIVQECIRSGLSPQWLTKVDGEVQTVSNDDLRAWLSQPARV